MLDKLDIPDKIIDKVYNDGLQTTVSESGKFLERIPRAINAAFSSLDCWILQREHNVEKTKMLLEENLKNAIPDKIVPPEPYIAVPAIQALSYSMSNIELQKLFANLLSKAMYEDTKDSVHPSFVEIIKQLSPNDALVLKEFSQSDSPIPTASLSIIMKSKGLHLADQPPEEKRSLNFVTNIRLSSLSEDQVCVSIDNLKRLGLISLEDIALSKKGSYDFIKYSESYSEIYKEFNKLNQNENIADHIHVYEKILFLSPLGKLFCQVCIIDLK